MNGEGVENKLAEENDAVGKLAREFLMKWRLRIETLLSSKERLMRDVSP